VMQDGRRFVSLSGVASVVADPALIDQLWSESWKVWFPKGKDDPSLRIVAVEPVEAAYWDMSGTTGINYVFEMAKAYVTGKRPGADDDQRHTARFKL
jgi:general stress protein 26